MVWRGTTNHNLEANSRVSVHLESATEVVIVEGEATKVERPEPRVSRTIDDQYHGKYDWRPSSESKEPVGAGWYRLEPAKMIDWTQFPADNTRWTRSDVPASIGEESGQ